MFRSLRAILCAIAICGGVTNTGCEAEFSAAADARTPRVSSDRDAGEQPEEVEGEDLGPDAGTAEDPRRVIPESDALPVLDSGLPDSDSGDMADLDDAETESDADLPAPDAEVPDAEAVDADLPDPDAGPPPCVDSASITFLFEAQPGDGQYTFRYANDPTPEEGLIPLGDETPFTFTDCQRPVEIWLEDSGGWIFVIGNDVDILMVNGVDILSVPLDEELVSYEPTEGVAQSFLQQGNVYIRIE